LRFAIAGIVAEKFRFFGKTLEVPETEAFKAQP
jgi:hypothetical protein